MQQSRQPDSGPVSPADPAGDVPLDPPATRHTEDIHVRNYDVRRSYRVRVTVTDGSEVVFARRYSLRPGQSTSELDAVDAGTYEVTVELAAGRSERAECVLADSPDDTALVEVGNGVVSVSQGLYR